VVVASDRRLAKIREYEVQSEPTVHQLIAELYDCDWCWSKASSMPTC
jgi:molybdopterin-guanine dinucleotide biosynthesis protein B